MTQEKKLYTEKDITIARNNAVKVKGKEVGGWHIGFQCVFVPFGSTNLDAFEAQSKYALKKQLLEQLNSPQN